MLCTDKSLCSLLIWFSFIQPFFFAVKKGMSKFTWKDFNWMCVCYMHKGMSSCFAQYRKSFWKSQYFAVKPLYKSVRYVLSRKTLWKILSIVSKIFCCNGNFNRNGSVRAWLIFWWGLFACLTYGQYMYGFLYLVLAKRTWLCSFIIGRVTCNPNCVSLNSKEITKFIPWIFM